MQYPTPFLYRIAGGACLLALAGTLAFSPPAASQFQPDAPVRLLSAGAAPFTESWGEMVRRAGARPPVSRLASAARRIARARWRQRPGRDAGELAGAEAVGALFSPPGRVLAQQLGTGFKGTDREEDLDAVGTSPFLQTPPDTMAAVGPDHLVEALNSVVSVFTRGGENLGTVSSDRFFSVVSGGITFPRGGTTDPRVLFDRRSGRWFLSLVEFGVGENGSDNNILLAVSRSDDPTGLFDKYVIPVGRPSLNGVDYFNDYPTLGVDDNGVYFGINVFGSASNADVYSGIAATRKSSLLGTSPFLGPTFLAAPIRDMAASPQPATNQDPAGPVSPEWFVASSPFTLRNTASGLTYRTLTWGGATPLVSRTMRLATTAYGIAPEVDALGSATPLDTGDDRLLMATVRGGRLWTCRNVGVNRTGRAGSDRAACEWLTLDVSRLPARLVQLGRVFDPAITNPRSYFYPSITVNGQGSAVMGFSGARATEFAGAYVTGRRAADRPGTMGAVALLKPGEASYNLVAPVDPNQLDRWGDYSAASLDPDDGMTIWTAQEYARTPDPTHGSTWGTWLAQILAPPPTLKPVAAVVSPGQNRVTLPLNGAGFYDPGDGYRNRLAVRFQLAGGGESGIGNVQFRSVAAGRVVVTFDVAADAVSGPRDVVVTNPDGQAAVAAHGVKVSGR